MVRMGLPLSLFRGAASRLCCASVMEPSARAGVGRGRATLALAPPLAIRAGVDARAAQEEEEEEEEEEGAEQPPKAKRQKREKQEKRPPPPRPNHFLALQVSHHPEVCTAITQVHASIAEHAPHLKRACVEAASAHLTVGVMALDGPEGQARAAAVLAELAGRLEGQQLLAPVEVQLEGLSHFKNQVLYLDLRQDDGLERLMQLAAATREHFQAAELLLEADRPFVPHVTVAKTSKLQGGWGRGGRGRGRLGSGESGRHGHRRGHGHGGGRAGGRGGGHDWRLERRSKQEQMERERQAEEELAVIDCAAGGGGSTEGRLLQRPGAAGGSAEGGSDVTARAALDAAPQPGGPAAPTAEAAAAAAADSSVPTSVSAPPNSSAAASRAALGSPSPSGQQPGKSSGDLGSNGASTVPAAAEAGRAAALESADEQHAQEQAQQGQEQGQQGEQDQSGHEQAQPREPGQGQPQQQAGQQGQQEQLDWRHIPAEAWAQHAAIVGGAAILAELQLCAMQGRKPGEYYRVLCSLPLSPASPSPGAGIGIGGSSGGAGDSGKRTGGDADSSVAAQEAAEVGGSEAARPAAVG